MHHVRNSFLEILLFSKVECARAPWYFSVVFFKHGTHLSHSGIVLACSRRNMRHSGTDADPCDVIVFCSNTMLRSFVCLGVCVCVLTKYTQCISATRSLSFFYRFKFGGITLLYVVYAFNVHARALQITRIPTDKYFLSQEVIPWLLFRVFLLSLRSRFLAFVAHFSSKKS